MIEQLQSFFFSIKCFQFLLIGLGFIHAHREDITEIVVLLDQFLCSPTACLRSGLWLSLPLSDKLVGHCRLLSLNCIDCINVNRCINVTRETWYVRIKCSFCSSMAHIKITHFPWIAVRANIIPLNFVLFLINLIS